MFGYFLHSQSSFLKYNVHKRYNSNLDFKDCTRKSQFHLKTQTKCESKNKNKKNDNLLKCNQMIMKHVKLKIGMIDSIMH